MTNVHTGFADNDAGMRRVVPLDAFEQAVRDPAIPPQRARHPLIISLTPGEFARFSSLCDRYRIRIIDEFERQAHDLAQIRLPAAGLDARMQLVQRLIDESGNPVSCGNWIYLPWEAKAVHLLSADDYFDVITNRNRDKITDAEQRLLRQKIVGVIGLSLGGEAAAAIAQEHLCGHIILADFDRLDLSNLNRLNAGFDELGLPKTTIAARRLARIDPYLRVTLYDEGVTEENAADFLRGLDLLVDECDGMRIKHRIRTLARERRLNIVFAGDERGFLSVEPHAHAHELDVFHGLIGRPQPSREDFATSKEFLIELTKWLGGWHSISARTRSSLEQVGETLCGFPQLASEARFAAGQVGHVARKLLLGERLRPYIGHVDLDEVIGADPLTDRSPSIDVPASP